MRKILIIVVSSILSVAWASAQEQLSLQKQIEEITADPALEQAVISICARTGDGRTLVDIDADNMLVPASNMKLISTGAAMHILGADYRFETKIGYRGSVDDGVLNGDLYIIGGADPTIGSKDSIAVSLEKNFEDWANLIRKAGIRRINGHIIGDGRYFEGMAENPTWLWNDLGTYYGAGATGLMFYENMQSFSVRAGKEVGSPLSIEPTYPDAPWMDFRYDCETGKAGTGDQLYMYISDLAPIAVIRGTFGVDRASKRLDCSNKYPEYTCASYFTDYLKNHGLPCSQGPADLKLCSFREREDSLIVLGSTSSPTLKRIVFETNRASNNLYAETLFKAVSKKITGNACYDSCYVALNSVLKDLAVNTEGSNVTDGSGLSRKNYLSADFFCRFLEAMMSSPCFEDYVSTLASPGDSGTLSYNLSKSPAELKKRIKVKSGSMDGVRCYSGYIIPTEGSKDETIIFSIMTNNCTSPSWKVRQLLDKMMASLAAAN